MSFAQPAPSTSSDTKIVDFVGHLILFYPREHRMGVQTSNGPADPIVADIVILTHPDGPKAEADILIFQKVLISSLKSSIGGDPVLARLARGTAKPGKSAPYVLQPYDQNDAAYATQYLDSVGGNPFPAFQAAAQAAPAPVAVPAPQPVPVAAPAAVPAPQPVPVAAPAVASAPMPQAPAAPQAVPAAGTAEAQAAAQALGMQVPPPAPGQ